MSSLATKEEFKPRQGLQRSLTYRPQVRWAYYVNFAIAAYSAIYLLSFGFLNLAMDWQFATYLAVTLWFPLAHFAITKYLLGPSAFSTVHIEESRLVIEKSGIEEILPFADVVAVSFYMKTHFGGWFSLKMKDNKSHRFTVVLERSEYILEALANFNKNLIPEDTLVKYRASAILADHAWAYINDTKKYSVIIKFLAIPVCIALFYSAFSVATNDTFYGVAMRFLVVFELVFLFNLVICCIFTAIFSRRLLNHNQELLQANPNHTKRDMEFETKLHKEENLLHYAFLISFGVWLLLQLFMN